jgi:DNA-directed RNA polymerase subunit RPC12/RpoP
MANTGSKVTPAEVNLGLYVRGFTMPKAIVKCGNCPATFKEKMPDSDYPTLQCPHCKAWNELPLVIAADGMITPTE